MRKTLKHLAVFLLAIAGLWLLCSFLAGILCTFAGSPKGLELPWSDFGDFVEAVNGNVYVECRFYGRILCYDKQGDFVGSYAYPMMNAKDTKLAAGKDGLVYFRTRNTVYGYDVSWKNVVVVTEDPSKPRIWKLSQSGRPELVRVDGVVPDRAVLPNELLFSPSQEKERIIFNCSDGSSLERGNSEIDRISKNGRVICKYKSAILLRFLKFPWPALLSIPLFLVFVFLALLLGKR